MTKSTAHCTFVTDEFPIVVAVTVCAFRFVAEDAAEFLRTRLTRVEVVAALVPHQQVEPVDETRLSFALLWKEQHQSSRSFLAWLFVALAFRLFDCSFE